MDLIDACAHSVSQIAPEREAHGPIAWRAELVAHLGGAEAVSAQQRGVIELPARTKLYLDSIDAWIMEQPSLVVAKRRAMMLIPARPEADEDGPPAAGPRAGPSSGASGASRESASARVSERRGACAHGRTRGVAGTPGASVRTDRPYSSGWPNRSRCATSRSDLRCFWPRPTARVG